MNLDYSLASNWLPLFFFGAMGVSFLLYVVLDGYDLGVGILLRRAGDEDKDVMISSIGPFWDANETWLVLAVGLLLVAFPYAHGVILTELYLPAALMLMGLILRGVSFDFRVKVNIEQKPLWNFLFYFGSLVASLMQGIMIGRVIIGFESGWQGWLFSLLVALFLPIGYSLLGACWLIMKTEGELQKKAVQWAKGSLWLSACGIALVSIATPWFSPEIFHKWFTFPAFYWLMPIPIATGLLFILMHKILFDFDHDHYHAQWIPFVSTVGIFWLALLGIAYSLFPYLVMDQVTIWEAAASTDALWMIFWGAVVVLPMILAYTAYSYKIFWGKTEELTYH
ncbi:cytochrome bd ubiquinol oxidase subunit II [Polynucleobacter sp. TUM22923]|jgi:cytochrome d ubiquinol oxidase subunit II|uniref:cytochrome d ubiquinol oxidase subunit II n=1 Tax=Polynucleobacter sp. TUM22923 TaxID=3022126 RepID=UPI00257476D5|nr:cytochrome d ubiquinol oxidase subunit II [Polynucleobacter sp. TUM22923]BDX22465.1 cytochrome bd ubiquinol oxidase subunit II [Polynucleobacter sp. TUM22923]